MDKKRIVVTGMGLVSPVGNTVAEAWQNIRNGVSGIDWIKVIVTDHISTKIGGEVKNFDADEIFGKRIASRTDRAQHFALVAAREAMQDSGLEVTDENRYDIACIVGTGIGSIRTVVEMVNGFAAKGERGVRPTLAATLLSDQIASQISIEFGLRGANYTPISACATGNNAIGDAADLIRLGRVKVALAGGSEACLADVVLSGLGNMKTLGHVGDDGDPKTVSRPFDVDRTGFVAGEGASILVLEDLEHALARGAKIYAEITGYGHTSDAYHVTAPLEDGASAAKAMQIAIADAGLSAEDIDYINAHGTGTRLNDKSETAAIKAALGEVAYNIPISSTKSMTGHMLGAAGAAEAIFGIMAVRDNFVPPTINLDHPDPDCDLDYIPKVGREKEVKHVLSNAFGFGGHNAVLVVSEFEG
ncbi:MAG: beta-ketoacyl-ACP synthase II [Anaerolineae bacterium]|nr:beta-ketoacyl-ACP synthase II [Anaerolineae bacterium]